MALEFGNMTSSDAVFDLNDCRNAIETEYAVNGKSIEQSLALHGGDIYVNNSRLSTVQEAVQALADSFDEKQPKIPEEKLEAVSNVDAERRATLELLYPDGTVYYTSQQTAECPIQIADEEWHGPVQAANGLWMWGKEAEITSPMTTFVLADGTIEKYHIVGAISPQWMIDNGFYDGSTWIKDVTSVSLGIDVTEIGAETFKGCSLSSIRLERQLSSIGNDAFYDCSELASVTIPDGVTSIGANTFRGCNSLASVIIPNSVKNIGNGAFVGCSGLNSMTIPDSVTSIGEYAFSDCSGLMSVTIPDSVTSIGDSAFTGCIMLTNVTIPDSVTSIGTSMFHTCSSLTSVTIGNSITSIGNNAFKNCHSLTSIEFEGNAPTVGTDAFAGVASGCKAVISPTATGFPAAGETWNGLIVEVKS